MYTIKQASRLTGVSIASLRTWERRYGLVVPARTDGGYRLYDEAALAVLSTMRGLIEQGWTPATAAEAIRTHAVPLLPASDVQPVPAAPLRSLETNPDASAYSKSFLDAAASLDVAGLEKSLDGGFGLGSFEHVVDSWLFPTLTALGEGWVSGEIDVAGEHAASHAVHARLSAFFQAAGTRPRGPAVVVGLPPGSQHELGALAFAAAIRRMGMHVLYLGSNVPVDSWQAAVDRHGASAAVLSVVMPEDRPAVEAVVRGLRQSNVTTICTGGSSGRDPVSGAHPLPVGIAEAARELGELVSW